MCNKSHPESAADCPTLSAGSKPAQNSKPSSGPSGPRPQGQQRGNKPHYNKKGSNNQNHNRGSDRSDSRNNEKKGEQLYSLVDDTHLPSVTVDTSTGSKATPASAPSLEADVEDIPLPTAYITVDVSRFFHTD